MSATRQRGFKVNRYFLKHPEMVLGIPTAESTQYAGQDYTVAPIEGADLAVQLHEAIQHIHCEYTEREIEQTESPGHHARRPRRAQLQLRAHRRPTCSTARVALWSGRT